LLENIPFSDFKEELRNYIGCWKTIVFAGVAISEGQFLSPAAIQIWATDTGQEQTEVFRFPQIPEHICIFKAVRYPPAAWAMIDDILDQKQIQLDGIKISFQHFKFARAAFLSASEYGSLYPEEIHKYVDIWPKLFLEGSFDNHDYLFNTFSRYIEEEFQKGTFLFHSLPDATSHLVGTKIGTNYQWGVLYAVLKIPLTLQAKTEGFKLVYKIKLPTNLERMPREMRCVAESSLGRRDEVINIPAGKRQGEHIVFSSSLKLHPDDQIREVVLYLGDKIINSIAIPQAELEHKIKSGNKIEAISTDTGDSKKVFVIHGRNEKLTRSMFDFLRALGLNPIEWNTLIKATEKGSPYIGEIIDKALEQAHAILVLLTGDDEAKLRQEFVRNDDPDYEKQLTPQARPNVLFEAGMAFGARADRTILVQVGKLRPWSDVGGRHITRLDNTNEKRQELADKLKTAGCDVDTSNQSWRKLGDFEGKKTHIRFERPEEEESITYPYPRAYCIKCHAMREIKNPEPVKLKSGRGAIKGICPVCGAGLFRMKSR
jgi:predicted nucleotide-binding protein